LWSPARDSRLLVAPAACFAGSVAARCGLAKVVRSRRQRCLTEGLRLSEFAPLSSNKQIERPQWSGSVAAMVSWRRLFFSASLAGRMHSFQTQRVSAPWRANPHNHMVHIFAIGRFRWGFRVIILKCHNGTRCFSVDHACMRADLNMHASIAYPVPPTASITTESPVVTVSTCPFKILPRLKLI
jgi:hypothetical protein